MKLEIGKEFPGYFKPLYPEEFEICSHFEVTAAIPTVLFAVTTWKENGKPNVCFHAWSCFHGDKTAFFAVMGNLFQHTHTYANILREKCFCINFLPIDCYGRLVETIHQNEYGTDEFAAGGFTVSDAKTIHARHRGGVCEHGVHLEGRAGSERRGHRGHGRRGGAARFCGGGVREGV